AADDEAQAGKDDLELRRGREQIPAEKYDTLVRELKEKRARIPTLFVMQLAEKKYAWFKDRCEPASTRILDAPEDELTQQHFRNFLKVADILPVRYRPRLVRTLLHHPAPVPVDTERWRADWVLAAEPTDWIAVHKTPLEPKQMSLLWKLRHGCVPTAKETHYGIPDGTPSCPICFSLADDGSGLLPEPNHREDLAHYFFDCTRVRRFWLLVGQFMRSAIPRAALSGPLTITPSEVVHGFGKWSRVLPNHRVWHGLAVWEIYRAHTEAVFDKTFRTGDAMFARWKHALMQRIVHDFYRHARHPTSRVFYSRWAVIATSWFQFLPSRSGRREQCTLTFSHPAHDPTNPCSTTPTSHTVHLPPRTTPPVPAEPQSG
ncbi:hypothetical protein H4R21_003193, partial [Coemansia helicoidea]